MNISVLYIYPEMVEINNEINLFRVVDKFIKESIVVYAKRNNNGYEILLTNTTHGQINQILDIENEIYLNKFIEMIKSKEEDIKRIKNLSEIEKYILKHDNI